MAHSITNAAGIDIGKEALEIALYPEGAGLQVANTPAGRRELSRVEGRASLSRCSSFD